VLVPVLGLFAPLMIALLAVVVSIVVVAIDLWRRQKPPSLDWPCSRTRAIAASRSVAIRARWDWRSIKGIIGWYFRLLF
jgi:hypothetical protein